jgi:hypothetical protein
MVGLADLSLELEEIAEVDVNPILVADGSVRAADALIVFAGAAPSRGSLSADPN